jgi:HMG (high mobility group) box
MLLNCNGREASQICRAEFQDFERLRPEWRFYGTQNSPASPQQEPHKYRPSCSKMVKKEGDDVYVPSSTSKRKRKDAAAPKKPLTAYNAFFREQRAKLGVPKTHAEQKNFQELGKFMGRRWKELNESERQVYEDMAEADRVRYSAEMTAYQQQQQAATAPAGDAAGGNGSSSPHSSVSGESTAAAAAAVTRAQRRPSFQKRQQQLLMLDSGDLVDATDACLSPGGSVVAGAAARKSKVSKDKRPQSAYNIYFR